LSKSAFYQIKMWNNILPMNDIRLGSSSTQLFISLFPSSISNDVSNAQKPVTNNSTVTE
jgi:hypothetical protein